MKIIFLCIWVFSLMTACSGQNNQLPKPSGKYLTGVTYMNLTDTSRKELFDNDQKSYRELTIKVWYPADKTTDYEPYLENPDLIVSNFGFIDKYRTLITNSSRAVPVSVSVQNYPVLIFSHGWGEHYSQNTILMEELASQGYIVFSIAHHYECKFSFYPDGRFVSLNMSSNRFQQFISEQSNPAAMEIFKKMAIAANDDDRKNIFTETNDVMPALMKESPKYWCDDIKFFIDELKKINNSDITFNGKLDLNRIGVFGMSMGGIATNEICIRDNRIKAGVNIDGGLYGSAISDLIITPYLFLSSQRYLGYGNLFTSRVDNDSYSITVKNADHYNFTDYALYPVRNQSQIGTIDPQKPILIMNKMVVLFFNKYLKSAGNIDLKKACGEFDIEYLSHEK